MKNAEKNSTEQQGLNTAQGNAELQVTEKRCSKCNVIKIASEFYKSSLYGLQSQCKKCKKYKPKTGRNFNRSKARERGDKTFISGIACILCGGFERYTCSSACVACNKIKAKEYYHSNPDKSKDRWNKYSKTEKGIKACRKSSKKYRLNPKNKEAIAEAKRKCRVKKPDLYNAISKSYVRKKAKAMPLWADNKEILEYYRKASKQGLEVDHVVPIKSDIVCGLHCIDNFQLLTRSENASKGNRYWPDMP